MKKVNSRNTFENSGLILEFQLVVEKMWAINNGRVFRAKWTEINLNKVTQSYGRQNIHVICIL